MADGALDRHGFVLGSQQPRMAAVALELRQVQRAAVCEPVAFEVMAAFASVGFAVAVAAAVRG